MIFIKTLTNQVCFLETLQNMFGQYFDVPQESFQQFQEILHERNLQKGELWIQEGEVCGKLGFIGKGIMRSFYYRDKKDITVSFSTKGEFVTSMSSFIAQKPSYESIEALDNCQVFELYYADLMTLFERDRFLEHIYRLILEQYYIELEEQLIFAKFKSAKERYLELMDNKPYIIQKASVGQVASYLDMSLETLSRIRATI